MVGLSCDSFVEKFGLSCDRPSHTSTISQFSRTQPLGLQFVTIWVKVCQVKGCHFGLSCVRVGVRIWVYVTGLSCDRFGLKRVSLISITSHGGISSSIGETRAAVASLKSNVFVETFLCVLRA